LDEKRQKIISFAWEFVKEDSRGFVRVEGARLLRVKLSCLAVVSRSSGQ
jgi:hypothetical protein